MNLVALIVAGVSLVTSLSACGLPDPSIDRVGIAERMVSKRFIPSHEIETLSEGAGRVHLISLASSKSTDPVAQRERGESAARLVLDSAEQRFPNAILYNSLEQNGGRFTEFLKSLSREVKAQDTVMIYTHSHGTPRGILINEVIHSWKEVGDLLLAIPARHVIVFTMSCYSGALVDYLRSVRSKWERRSIEGRGLLVISAQNASTVAGPNLIEGQLMNGLPFAISQAFENADGTNGQPCDGELNFEELSEYVYTVSRKVGSNSRYINDSQMVGSYPSQRLISSK